MRFRGTSCILALALALAACEREERRLRELPPSAGRVEGAVRMSDLQPGRPRQDLTLRSPYDNNAYAIAEGKRLYEAFNCVGCHAHGGGDIGPPLMDDLWIYGSDPENIYSSIVEGRPNGMPSFRGKLPEYQVWQLVSYVRSMVRLVRKDAAPGRSDHMAARPSEQASRPEEPHRARAEHIP